jgi:CRP/FNR family cyclic AMP-dependent transcriptional regulator
MNKQMLIESLREVRFLHDVEQEHLERIAEVAELVSLDKNKLIFRDGDQAESVYFIVRGGVLLEMCAPGVGCKRILTLGPGDLLGWSALLERARLTATARTTDATILIKVHAGLLLTLCDHNPRFGYEIMHRTSLSLAKRLHITRMQLLDLYGGQTATAPDAASKGGEDAS